MARSVIRIAAFTSDGLCLAVWGTTALDHTACGGPVIDEFYATTLLVRNLDEAGAGWLLLAARENWHLKLACLRDQHVANCPATGHLPLLPAPFAFRADVSTAPEAEQETE